MIKFFIKLKNLRIRRFIKLFFVKQAVAVLKIFYGTDIAREITAKAVVDPEYKFLFAGDRSRGLLLNTIHTYNQLRMKKLMFKEILGKSEGKKIIIGPWLAEVGYEVLYWSPFISYLIQENVIDPNQAIILTRGSAYVWYPEELKTRVEIFECISPEEFKTINDHRIRETSSEKHITCSQSEIDLVQKCIKDYDPKTTYILHPSIMYNFMSNWIKGGEGKKFIERILAPRQHLEVKTDEFHMELPEEYDVVRFYSRDTMPDNEANRKFILGLISKLAKNRPVVVLNSMFNFDEHNDFEISTKHSVITVDHLMTPQNNLALQSKVIAGANCFYGTYGGLSYVPIFNGVPVISFYSSKLGLNTVHHDLANHIAMGFDVSFSVFKVQDFERTFLSGSNPQGLVSQ